MKAYEIYLILRHDLKDAAVDAALKDFQAQIEKNDGKVLLCDKKGRKKLAYAINESKDSNQALLQVEFDPTKLNILKKYVDLNENINRMGLFNKIEIVEKK